jgi:hypothetical protein
MRLYILALGALTLVGCVTPQELAREDHDRCTGYGFQPGSETYAQCRMTLDTNRQASEQAAFMAYFAMQQQRPPMAIAPMPVPAPVRTTSCNEWSPGYTRCTTW